ncbi:MAG: peptidylprolyl isomerase [bacterium]
MKTGISTKAKELNLFMKNIMKKIKILLFIIANIFAVVLFSASVRNANAIIIDQVIAVVNKTPITLYEFAKFNRPAFENYEQMQNEASQGIFTKSDSAIMAKTKGVLNILVDSILIKQEEEKAAIYISPKQINAYIKAVAIANNLTVSQFFNFLGKRGISKEAYIKQVKKHFAEVELLRKVYGNKMFIANRQLINYYKKNIEEFRGEPKVNLKLIFLSVPSNSSKKIREKIYKKIYKIRNIAISGNEGFSALARKYSEDPSEKNGGRIGYIYRDKLSPSFSKTAFKLHVGEISGIIKTKFGYAVLKSVGKKMGSFKTFKQAKPEIFSIIEKYKTGKYLEKLLKKARKNAYIKILIAV